MRKRSSPAERQGVFYGWYMVGAMFFMVMMGVGGRQGYGLFFDTWTDLFGVSVSVLSAIAAAGWVMNGLSQPVVGALTDRFGGRVVMTVSTAVLGLGLIVISISPNVVVLGLIYVVVVSFAMGGAMFAPAGATLSRWFRRKRGTAISVISAGASMGGILLVPFMAFLLQLTDWRTTWLVVGLITALLAAPLVFFVVRSDPKEMGLEPDGGDGLPRRQGRVHSTEVRPPLQVDRWQNAYKSAPMWQLSVAYVVCGITTASIAVHFVPYAVSRDISVSTAALAFAVLSVINMTAVLGVGILSDRIQRKNALTVVYAVRGLAFLALVLLPPTAGLWVFAIVAGSSWLATVPTTTALVTEIYGVPKAGTVNGMLTLVHQIMGGLAVLAAGASYDLFGTYTPAFVVMAGTLVAASVFSWSVRERTFSSRFQEIPDSELIPEGA